MGNCLRKCFGVYDRRRRFLNPRYTVEKDSSIEFQNLIDEDDAKSEMTKLVTEREKQLLASRQYYTLVNEQQRRDAEQDRKLQEDEEELQREEEAYMEAKREATRIARLQAHRDQAAHNSNSNNGPKSWKAGADGDWEIAGGEDDFEMFLESVRERSLKATAHLRKGSSDGQSSNSSPTPVPPFRERSHTGGSNSLELEWDHDEDTGIMPMRRERSNSEEDLMNFTGVDTGSTHDADHGDRSPAVSIDLEWDTDTEFQAADDKDTQNLLSEDFQLTT